MPDPIQKPDAQWKDKLTPEQYEVTRNKGTEPPFSGQYYQHKEKGTYLCTCCGQELYNSTAKYDSGSGWPSFWAPVNDESVATETDTTHGMRRTEIKCSRCDAHLGHVFDDGPAPTGMRHCVNSLSLTFKPADD